MGKEAVRHQVIKEAVEKYERMCKVEDDVGDPSIGPENGNQYKGWKRNSNLPTGP
jgi:hypothetical protein